MDFERLRKDVRHITQTLATTRRLPKELCVGRRRKNVLREFGALPADGEAVVVVLEGFLLFHDQELARMCDIQLWLEAECDTCMQRRYHRKSRGGQKQSLQQFGEWYRGLVWQSYLEHRDTQLANAPGALHLRAEDGPAAMAAAAEAGCQTALCTEASQPRSAAPVETDVAVAPVETDVAVKPVRRWQRR
jgi:hypothetical protein